MLNMHLVELYEETNKKTDKAEIAQTNRHVTIANDKAVWASRAWVSPDPFFPIFHCQIIIAGFPHRQLLLSWEEKKRQPR